MNASATLSSFFVGHNEDAAANDSNPHGIEVSNDKITFQLNEEDFEGMSDKTITVTLIVMAVVAIFATVTVLLCLPALLLALLGAPYFVVIGAMLAIGAITLWKTDLLNEKIIIPAAIKMSIGYAWIHRKVKSVFAKKAK